jgi:hypothetical protein
MGFLGKERFANTWTDIEKTNIVDCLNQSKVTRVILVQRTCATPRREISKLKDNHQACIRLTEKDRFTKKELLKVANYISGLEKALKAVAQLQLSSHFEGLVEQTDKIIAAYAAIGRVSTGQTFVE